MDTIEIDSSNIHVLEKFMTHDFTPSFRYFTNKTADDVIKNHYKTIVLVKEGSAIAYAHIDYDAIHDMFWLGCCVISTYRNQGIGTKVVKTILDYFIASDITSLFLTVDKENEYAIKLYKKHDFHIIRSTERVHVMNHTKNNIISVPVSFGEAIDKLTILDIKRRLITDHRKDDVEREFHTLQHHLLPVLDRVAIHYQLLKHINQQIWDDQDTFRYSSHDDEKTRLCKKIIEDNDARFRIKNKINLVLSSVLKEQKGYVPKRYSILYANELSNALLDSIILYQSIFHDKVELISSMDQQALLQEKYTHDPAILITSQSSIQIPDKYYDIIQLDIKNDGFFKCILQLYDSNRINKA
jgi:N-acetylglutamate synthase-like GNAT family acetyltransferase